LQKSLLRCVDRADEQARQENASMPQNSFATFVFVVILAVGAALTYAMYGISASWGSNWMLIGALIVATVVAFAIKVAVQWNRAVVLRLGRFHALRGPGLS
jgi:hypothetical protein